MAHETQPYNHLPANLRSLTNNWLHWMQDNPAAQRAGFQHVMQVRENRIEFLHRQPSGELSRIISLMGPDRDILFHDRTLRLSFSSSGLGPTTSLDDYARLTMRFARGHTEEMGADRYEVTYNQGISEQPYQIVTTGNDAVTNGEELLTEISGREIALDLPDHPLLERFLSVDPRF